MENVVEWAHFLGILRKEKKEISVTESGVVPAVPPQLEGLPQPLCVSSKKCVFFCIQKKNTLNLTVFILQCVNHNVTNKTIASFSSKNLHHMA